MRVKLTTLPQTAEYEDICGYSSIPEPYIESIQMESEGAFQRKNLDHSGMHMDSSLMKPEHLKQPVCQVKYEDIATKV